MHKIHVSRTYNKDRETVFKIISDHVTFLSGGGLTCELVKQGTQNNNGDGAIRRIVMPKFTFEERIYDYKPNLHFAYQIIKTIPKQPLIHEKGWLDFTLIDGKTRVDWYSNFTITTPIVGRLVGWFVKRQMAEAFLKRLDYVAK